MFSQIWLHTLLKYNLIHCKINCCTVLLYSAHFFIKKNFTALYAIAHQNRALQAHEIKWRHRETGSRAQKTIFRRLKLTSTLQCTVLQCTVMQCCTAPHCTPAQCSAVRVTVWLMVQSGNSQEDPIDRFPPMSAMSAFNCDWKMGRNLLKTWGTMDSRAYGSLVKFGDNP